MTCSLLALLFVVLSPGLPRSDDEPDYKRYRKELEPGRDAAQRIETLKNVAYYDSTESTDLLLDLLSKTLRHLEQLEEERAENDGKIEKALKSQILNAGKSDGAVNFSGIEEYQDRQKKLGAAITAEEQVLRGFRDAMAQMKDRDSWELMAKTKSKRPARLRPFLIDVLGHIDDPEVTEILVELMNDKELEIRVAAAESLSHHDREHVPVPAYGALLNDERWQVRVVAIDALGRLGGPEAVALLVARTPLESGRQLTEIVTRLEIMTGQKLGKTPQAWLNWWKDAGAAFERGPVVLTRPITAKGDGRMEYWGIRVDSLRVVFVIDISLTMAAALDDPDDLDPPPGKSRLDLARRQVKAAISSLSSDATFNIIAYSDIVIAWEEDMQPASQSAKEQAFDWLDRLAPISSTNIFDALEMAFELSATTTRDKYYDRAGDTILFLSDGGPTAGRTTDCDEILAQVQEWNRIKKLTIHTFGIGKQINRSFMEALAVQNGGQCKFVD